MVEPLCERCRTIWWPRTIGSAPSNETGNSGSIEDAVLKKGDPKVPLTEQIKNITKTGKPASYHLEEILFHASQIIRHLYLLIEPKSWQRRREEEKLKNLLHEAHQIEKIILDQCQILQRRLGREVEEQKPVVH